MSGFGHWLVTKDFEARPMVMLEFRSVDDQSGRRVGSTPFQTQMYLWVATEGWRMFYFSGDADEGNRIYFERRPS